jgi:hypothetical protein
MHKHISLLLITVLISACQSNSESQSDRDPADEVFQKAFEQVLKAPVSRGIPVDGWYQYGSMFYDVPECDSAYYFVAIEEKVNHASNQAIFQKIFYQDGDFKTEERIDTYQPRDHEGQKSYLIKDLRNNILIFHREKNGSLRADKTNAILEKISGEAGGGLPLLRREAGLMLPGRTFQRCRDNQIMAFFHNTELNRLGQFMEVYVGEKKTGSILIEGLYTKPDYGEPEMFMITEIKMTNKRSNCPN